MLWPPLRGYPSGRPVNPQPLAVNPLPLGIYPQRRKVNPLREGIHPQWRTVNPQREGIHPQRRTVNPQWSMVTSPDSPQKTPANTHITLINKVKTRIAPTYLQSPKIGLNGVLKVIFGNRWQLNIQVKPTFLFGYCGANLALRGSVITNLSR